MNNDDHRSKIPETSRFNPLFLHVTVTTARGQRAAHGLAYLEVGPPSRRQHPDLALQVFGATRYFVSGLLELPIRASPSLDIGLRVVCAWEVGTQLSLHTQLVLP